jgi:hypothetical protein
MKQKHIFLLTINLVLLTGFGVRFLARQNFEFLIYIGVILFFLGVIGITLRKIDYTTGSLIGLTVWAAMHLAGGGIAIGDGVLYDLILIPVSKTWPILRYDQLVHIWGFGSATVVLFDVLRSVAPKPLNKPVATGILLVMGGLGFGALNEIVEFIVSSSIPESGVGGYLNTSLDLCANLIGALLALVYIRLRPTR